MRLLELAIRWGGANQWIVLWTQLYNNAMPPS